MLLGLVGRQWGRSGGEFLIVSAGGEDDEAFVAEVLELLTVFVADVVLAGMLALQLGGEGAEGVEREGGGGESVDAGVDVGQPAADFLSGGGEGKGAAA